MKLADIIKFAKTNPVETTFLAAFCGIFFAYGSTKPPRPPEVTEKGNIKITSAKVDAEKVEIKWEADDSRIVAGESVFIVEAREKPIKLGEKVVFWPTRTDWYEIGRTKDFELAQEGVWTDKTREVRIRTVLEVGE